MRLIFLALLIEYRYRSYAIYPGSIQVVRRLLFGIFSLTGSTEAELALRCTKWQRSLVRITKHRHATVALGGRCGITSKVLIQVVLATCPSS